MFAGIADRQGADTLNRPPVLAGQVAGTGDVLLSTEAKKMQTARHAEKDDLGRLRKEVVSRSDCQGRVDYVGNFDEGHRESDDDDQGLEELRLFGVIP